MFVFHMFTLSNNKSSLTNTQLAHIKDRLLFYALLEYERYKRNEKRTTLHKSLNR